MLDSEALPRLKNDDLVLAGRKQDFPVIRGQNLFREIVEDPTAQ